MRTREDRWECTRCGRSTVLLAKKQIIRTMCWGPSAVNPAEARALSIRARSLETQAVQGRRGPRGAVRNTVYNRTDAVAAVKAADKTKAASKQVSASPAPPPPRSRAHSRPRRQQPGEVPPPTPQPEPPDRANRRPQQASTEARVSTGSPVPKQRAASSRQ